MWKMVALWLAAIKSYQCWKNPWKSAPFCPDGVMAHLGCVLFSNIGVKQVWKSRCWEWRKPRKRSIGTLNNVDASQRKQKKKKPVPVWKKRCSSLEEKVWGDLCVVFDDDKCWICMLISLMVLLMSVTVSLIFVNYPEHRKGSKKCLQ